MQWQANEPPLTPSAKKRRTAEEYCIHAASARFDSAARLERLAGMYLVQADRIKRLRLMAEANANVQQLGKNARKYSKETREPALFNSNMPPFRVTCGWPLRGALSKKNKPIGQCFHPSEPADEKTELIISMCLDDPDDRTTTQRLTHAPVITLLLTLRGSEEMGEVAKSRKKLQNWCRLGESNPCFRRERPKVSRSFLGISRRAFSRATPSLSPLNVFRLRGSVYESRQRGRKPRNRKNSRHS